LLKAGIHSKIVSERLGHANIGITLDAYSHVLPGLQERAVQCFDEMLEARAIVEDVSKMFAKSSG
jgi:integrase